MLAIRYCKLTLIELDTAEYDVGRNARFNFVAIEDRFLKPRHRLILYASNELKKKIVC